MKNPNGYGTVVKLPGKRRRPYAPRITTGIVDGVQKYKYLDYFETYAEAALALAQYNKKPYDFTSRATFAEVYDRWSAIKFDTIKDGRANSYKTMYKLCRELHGIPFADLRLSHLQHVVDTCGKNYPTLRVLRDLFRQLYDFALKHDICEKNYAQHVEINHHKPATTTPKHTRISADEINHLWANLNLDEYVDVILMFIYSGVRGSELMNLKKSDVHLAERYFDIVSAKTAAGVRKVPIADKTLPFFEHWMQKNDSPYLITGPAGQHLTFDNYYKQFWLPLMPKLNMTHFPHDARHTTISMLAEHNVNPTIIKQIVGHSGAMSLTERVYTHFDLRPLLDAINLL